MADVHKTIKFINMSCGADGFEKHSEKPSDFWFDFLLHSKYIL